MVEKETRVKEDYIWAAKWIEGTNLSLTQRCFFPIERQIQHERLKLSPYFLEKRTTKEKLKKAQAPTCLTISPPGTLLLPERQPFGTKNKNKWNLEQMPIIYKNNSACDKQNGSYLHFLLKRNLRMQKKQRGGRLLRKDNNKIYKEISGVIFSSPNFKTQYKWKMDYLRQLVHKPVSRAP